MKAFNFLSRKEQVSSVEESFAKQYKRKKSVTEKTTRFQPSIVDDNNIEAMYCNFTTVIKDTVEEIWKKERCPQINIRN